MYVSSRYFLVRNLYITDKSVSFHHLWVCKLFLAVYILAAAVHTHVRVFQCECYHPDCRKNTRNYYFVQHFNIHGSVPKLHKNYPELSFPDVEKERLVSSNMVPTNMYDSMCVPDLGTYLEYSTGTILPGEDRKPLTVTPTPAHTPTPASTNNNFLHEGKSNVFIFIQHVVIYFIIVVLISFT